MTGRNHTSILVMLPANMLLDQSEWDRDRRDLLNQMVLFVVPKENARLRSLMGKIAHDLQRRGWQIAIANEQGKIGDSPRYLNVLRRRLDAAWDLPEDTVRRHRMPASGATHATRLRHATDRPTGR